MKIKFLAAVAAALICSTALAGPQTYKAPKYHAPKSSLSSSYHAPSSTAPVHVRGYTTKSGTYVAPHYRTTPDHTKANNWSSKPNVNPYTGKAGTKDPYSTGGGE